MGATPAVSPIDSLVDALGAEKIRFVVIGMMGAVLQGVPAVTFDVDLWVDLRPRQYMRLLNLARRLGGEVIANTVVAFGGEVTVNFIYAVTGLRSFHAEYRAAEHLRWGRHEVAVLPLERILASKRACARPKDLAHIPLLERTLQSRRFLKQGRSLRRRHGESRPSE